MKLTRSLLCLFLIAASTSVVRAASVCSEDPERCNERGASVRRTTGTVTSKATVTMSSTTSVTTRKAVSARAMPARNHAKSARVAPLSPTAATTTPGMGMLLKLTGGNGGDVSWFPSKPSESVPGASWVL